MIDIARQHFGDRVLSSGVHKNIVWCVASTDSVLTDREYLIKNGYIHVDEKHAWRGLSYDEVEERFDVVAPGGLTYGDSDGWFGFDTAHYTDFIDFDLSRFGVEMPSFSSSLDQPAKKWTVEEVAEEARKLADQAALSFKDLT